MSANKSTRITISGRNLQFLQDLSEQMDEPNLAAVMTYLLTDIRGLGYRFGDKSASTPQSTLQAPIGFDSRTFELTNESDHNERNYIDPVIQRLLDAGLEMEF